jgi:nicotinate-nucleotide adenylyltransferase
MKIALFGGAFDPITKAHIQTAEIVLNSGLFDEVWLCPCYQHRYNKKLAACRHRSAMISLASFAYKKIKLFNYECRYKLSGNTFDFLKTLFEDKIYNENEYSLVIGQDNANTIENWYKHEEIRKIIPFVVLPRQGYEILENAWYAQPPHIDLTKTIIDLGSCSSTEVRKAVVQKDWNIVSTMVDPKVLLYLEYTPLY